MGTSPDPAASAGTANRETFRAAFLRNCHELIGLAYETLESHTFQSAQETEITGELVRAMEGILESDHAPAWAPYMFVADDPPVNAPGRLGKRRRRVDIKIEAGQRGQRPRLQFEAKRLHHSGSVEAYLGPAGLGLFLNGEYGREQESGGMLGYVQSGEPAGWWKRIADVMGGSPKSYQICEGEQFMPVALADQLSDTHRSRHDRPSVGLPISIYHTFLRFS